MTDPPNGTVTLLFTDMESSTQLLRLLGERYAAVIADHQRLLRDAIATHHGYEVDTQGDAFFAVFSRAADALAAAVAAQRVLASHSWPAGAIVRVRMGLHTGQPLLSDGRYIGLDVHRAARIAAAAHGGQVLLSESTTELVRDGLGETLGLRSLGEHVLKDFERPETLFQLLIENLIDQFPPLRGTIGPQMENPTTSTRSPTLRFVDRERESETLRAGLTGALAGRGSVILLAGDAGIGKTRLVEQLAGEARQRGAEVLWGRCWENEGAPPFWPWVEILRGLARNRPPLVLRSELGTGGGLIAELVPELRESALGGFDLAATPLMAPEEARFQLFDAITTFLINVTQSQPLVLLLDDLHWADKSSLLVLEFLQQRLGGARLLVLGTYRNLEIGPGHPLAELLPALRRGRDFGLVVLSGLQEDAVGDMVVSFLEQPMTERDSILARVLQEETEGNPFFVQEELRYLVENERIVWREGIWTSDVTSIAELGLPDAVREVIGRRLSRLSETATRLLPQAAVIGREFEAATLSRLGDITEAAFDAALDEAETARIVEQMPGQTSRYRFSHALFQETLYADIPSARRSRLHRQVGEALEHQYAVHREPHLAELAYHFVQAGRSGDAAKAIDFARRAGERALATYGYEEAVRLFETALRVQENAKPEDQALRCDLLLALAGALLPSGEARRVADDVAPEAFQIAEASEDRRRAFEASRAGIEALLRFGLSTVTATDEFRTWLNRADHYAEPGTDGRLWVDNRLQFAQGTLGFPGRTWDARLQNLERALVLGDETILCLALNTLMAAGTPQQWREQVQVARDYAEHRWQAVAVHQRSAFYVYCAYRLLDAGDRQSWEMLCDQIRVLAERTHDRYALFWTFYQEHERLLIDGLLEDGLALQERALQESRYGGMQLAVLNSARRMGIRARLFLGRAAENVILLEEFGEVLKQPVDPRDPSVLLCWAYLERRADVNQVLDWLLSPEGALADREILAIARYLEAAVLMQHREAVAALAEALAPAAGAGICSTAYTCAARHLSAAAALLGDHERALTYARQALDVTTRIAYRPETALVHLQLAELLIDEGPRGEAADHLDLAITEFREMKMRPSLERAEALQRRLPSMNSPTDDSSR